MKPCLGWSGLLSLCLISTTALDAEKIWREVQKLLLEGKVPQARQLEQGGIEVPVEEGRSSELIRDSNP